jgi:hypothetical protein
MNDALLRGRLLTFFNDRRDNAGGWVPTSDINLSGGEPITLQTIGRQGRELADAKANDLNPPWRYSQRAEPSI